MNGRLIRSIVVLAMASPLAVALSPVAAAGGAICHGAAVTDTSTDRVSMAENCFTPTIVRIDVGQSVTWTNKDGTAHGVTGANGAWGAYDEIRQGGQTTVRFTRSGIYPYFCFIHNGMIGAVVVGDGGASLDSSAAAAPVVAVSSSPGAAAETSQASDSVPVSTRGASNGWKAATAVGFGMFAVAVGMLARSRIRSRRPRANQTEGLSLS